MYNILGDIHGDYDTMIALLKQMPKNSEPIGVGDLIDRGMQSKQVLDFFMKYGRSVLGNHCHMFVDAYCGTGNYELGLYPTYNGGIETLKSFSGITKQDDAFDEMNVMVQMIHPSGDKFIPKRKLINFQEIPKKYASWMHGLPHYIKENGVFISHSAKHPNYTLEKLTTIKKWFNDPTLTNKEYMLCNNSLLWNQGVPRKMKDAFQIHGHMRHKQAQIYKDDEGMWGINLDTMPHCMTGIHWPSKKIYTQELIK